MANQRGAGVGYDPFDPGAAVRRDRQLEPSVYPTGQAAGALANVSGRLAAKVGALADQLAADTGRTEGAAAAATDPNWRPSGGWTIRARAADRAGVDTYLSNLSARFHADALTLSDQHKDDPAAFQAAYKGLVDDYRRRHVFPEIVGPFETDATTLGTSLSRAALTGFEAKQKDQRQASLIGDMQTRDTAAQRLLAGDPSDPATTAAFGRLQAEQEAAVRGMVANGTITAVQGEKMVIAQRQAGQAAIIGARASAMTTSTDVEAYRAQLRKDFAAGKAPGVSDFGQIDGALDAIARQKRAAEETAGKQLDAETDAWLKLGDSAGLASLAAKAAALGPEAVAKVDLARKKLLAAQGIGVLPPDQAAAFAERQKAEISAPVTAGDPTALRRYLTPGKDPSHADNLNPAFAGELQRMFEAMPPELQGQVSIYSGFRTTARQAQLFADAVQKYGSPQAARRWVAPPGRSNHNHGVAADLRFGSDEARQWVHEHAAEYGLHFRMGHEDWHIEPIDIKGALAGRSAKPAGLLEAGNIDLARRPVVHNPDGTISTVRSMSFEEDGKEILVPTVSDDGRILTNQEAIDLYHQTGRHLGKFDTAANATAYADRLHNSQAEMYGPRGGTVASANMSARADFVDYLDKAVEDHRKAVTSDPLGAAASAGLIGPVTPLDFGAAPEDLAGAMRNRIAQADAAGQAYGLASAPYVRPDERAALKSALDKGGDKALGVLSAIVDGAGAAAPVVLQEIGVEQPALVHAASVARATGDLSFARQVAAAQRLRSEGAKPPMPPEDTVTATLAETLGPSLSLLDPLEAGRTRAAVQDAAAAEMLRRGIDPKDKAAVATVVAAAAQAARGRTVVAGEAFGGVAEVYYGSPYWEQTTAVEVPPEVKADRFGAVLDAITDQDLTALPDPPVGPDGKPLPAEALRRLAPMLAPGGYAFGVTDAATASTTLAAAKSGQPFVLPWRRMAPVLRARVPDAFR